MLGKSLIIWIACLTWLHFGAEAMDDDQFFAQSDAFFKTHVDEGLVKYGQIKSNTKLLQDLISYVANAEIKSMSGQAQLAFYINAYNLWVIHHIIEYYPVDAPMSIEGFFDKKKIKIAGEEMTLNDLENGKIRAFQDPRIHFVLVCAALGCPPLADFSYTPSQLNHQLEQQTRLALNHRDFLKKTGDKVLLSEIFKWYRDDFGASDAELLHFINTYRNQPLPSQTRLDFYQYDWTLNDASPL
ncbi:MAG: DUF547 domain-containing protein [Cyclobacteriaceae bacterium]|nr:DUF547 domain-containing protein [Cyclobacteriaceae bacterium]